MVCKMRVMNKRAFGRLCQCYSTRSFTPTSFKNLDDNRAARASDESILVDVTDLANAMRTQVRAYTSAAGTANDSSQQLEEVVPKVRMVGILAEGPDRTDAETYSALIQSTFADDGLGYEVHRCLGDCPESIESAIQELNRSDVSGILVFYPLFPVRTASLAGGYYLDSTTGVHFRKAPPPYYLNAHTGVAYKTVDDYLRDCVVPSKDVEGVCHDHRISRDHRQLFRARGGPNGIRNDVYIPCTVAAVLKILDTYHLPKMPNQQQRYQGCIVTIVNRSAILGRPLAALLAVDGATVYSVDKTSIIQFHNDGRMRRCNNADLTSCLRQSSVIITAVPSTEFQLNCDAIVDYATVVDVSEHSNVDQDKLLRKRGIQLISRIGKVTIASLEHNLIRLHRQQNPIQLNSNH